MQIKVEAKIRAFWNSLKEFRDVEMISRQSGINRVSISNAIRGKNCSSRTFLAINDFYTEKKQRLDESKAKITHAA